MAAFGRLSMLLFLERGRGTGPWTMEVASNIGMLGWNAGTGTEGSACRLKLRAGTPGMRRRAVGGERRGRGMVWCMVSRSVCRVYSNVGALGKAEKQGRMNEKMYG